MRGQFHPDGPLTLLVADLDTRAYYPKLIGFVSTSERYLDKSLPRGGVSAHLYQRIRAGLVLRGILHGRVPLPLMNAAPELRIHRLPA